ncbi:hypothetical protein J2X19_000735 [Rhodoferax ferrireducens]|uniref:Lipoprotein n=1 Tax=Rhodoferax ferrireducens TaxID=192843 RepID=A0ABU2C420_9BURK|nr:hypothetical protein [Rhodoferax ferrireducens]
MEQEKILRNLAYAVVFSTISLLCGCVGVAPTRLAPESKVQSIVLEEPYQYIANFPGSQRMQVTLTSGRYVAVARDESGFYYVGPPLCYRSVYVDPGWMGRQGGAGKHVAIADCGIHVPSDESVFPYAFSIVGTYLTTAQMNAVDATGVAGQKDTPAEIPLEAFPSVPTGISSLGAGVGMGVGLGIASALAAAEEGRFVPLRNQEVSPRLRKIVQRGLQTD